MNLKRQMIRLVVCLMALFLNVAAMAQAEAATEPAETVSDALMRAIERVSLANLEYGEAVQVNLDRSAFEQDALIENLDFDAPEITTFVAEQIAFEPYAGVLRGAQGTLLARAGNALDQSLLLATLLNDAGFNAVIRAGSLTNAEAARLVNTLHQRPPAPEAWNTTAVARAQTELDNSFADLNKAYAESGREPQFTFTDVMAGIEQDRREILATLDSAGIKLGSKDADPAIVREAEQYFWVSYREGPSKPWVAAHPAFGKAGSPDVEIKQTYSGSLPPELSHRVRLELIVEQRFGGKMKTNAMMSPMEIPSANLAASDLSMGLVPDALTRKDPYANGASPLDDTRFLIPIINDAIPKGGLVLTLDGTLVPPDVISVSQAGIFETVGNRFLSAASSMQGLGLAEEDQKILVALESVRLRVTVIHPTAGERTIERFLYRAPGESILEQDADEETRRRALVAELARSHSLGFASGAITPAFVADATLADLAQLAPMIRAWADPALDECKTLDCLPKTDTKPNKSSTTTAMFLASFDQQMPVEPGSVVYRDAPNIVRLSQPYFPEASPLPGVFDIMNNSRRAFRQKDDRPYYAPELVLKAGVAETHLERLQPGEPGGVDSTIERPISADATTQLKVLSRDMLPAFFAARKMRTEQALIDNAHANGSVVLLARSDLTDENALLGWWEVDPESGRTLGMARYGGPSITEYIPHLIVGTFIVLAISGPIRCATDIDIERWEPGTGPPRLQRASYLACAFCWSKTYIAHPWETFTSSEEASEDRRYCIGEMDGWEY